MKKLFLVGLCLTAALLNGLASPYSAQGGAPPFPPIYCRVVIVCPKAGAKVYSQESAKSDVVTTLKNKTVAFAEVGYAEHKGWVKLAKVTADGKDFEFFGALGCIEEKFVRRTDDKFIHKPTD